MAIKRPQGTATNIVKELTEGTISKSEKKRYVVNVYFDSADEDILKAKAKEKGLSVSSYIKSLVKEDINK